VISCSNCGAENPSGQKFCGECGTALAATCSSCGAANPSGQRFCGECGSPLAGEGGSAPSVAVERRLVSVLFADLVGFTPLSEDRDAEEVRALLSRYFEVAADVIARYGGVVEKFIGDAVMAVWGTPVAQEDDAERAVRAALDLVAAVSAFGGETGMPELGARAAVLTGEAAVNLGAAGQGMVAGDLVNSASRVQAAAEPHVVLVGESTRRATESAIAYSDAGSHELKGKTEAMQLWRAMRVTAGRAGGLKSQGLEPPFVGRDRELRLAKELFHTSADERKAHVLSITGIAGIGKSRLAWELYKYLDGITQNVAWHRGRCLAYGDGVTYWALAEMVRMRAGIAEREDTESASAKLRAALELAVDDTEEREWIRVRLAQMLSLEARQDLEQADLFGGWRLFFERLAERDPVVLAFEDMQWADAPLLAFIEYLLEWSRSHRILVLVLARPELTERHAQWTGGLRNATTLALEPLSREAMRTLLVGFVPGLPEEVRDLILDRSEGVPLYAVETVRMLLDRGLLEQVGDEYRPTGTIATLEVPETLQALIAARLDGLAAEERKLLQDAAVLGKTFTKDGLAAVSGQAEPNLDAALTGLVRKEVLSLQVDPRSPERGQYSFLQDLLRQVAYETLPRRERKSRHLAAAAHLEHRPEHDELVEIVASHYVSALELDPEGEDASDIRDRAEATLVRAGEHAVSLGASEAAQRYFERAVELAGAPLRQAELHERAGLMAWAGGRPSEAREHFEEAVSRFEILGLTHPSARCVAWLGIVTWHLEADIQRAVSDMERAYAVLASEEHDSDLATLVAQLARALYFMGRVDEAMERNELALELAEALELPDVLSHGLNTKSLILYYVRRRPQEATVLMRHALEVALTHERSEPALRAFNNMTSYFQVEDRYREAIEHGRDHEALARRVGSQRDVLQVLHWRANLLAALGQWDQALAIVDEIQNESGPDLQKQGSLVSVLWIFARQGELAEARRRLAIHAGIHDSQEVQSVIFFRYNEAEVLLGEGKPEDALAAAELALEGRAEHGLAAVEGALEVALSAAFLLCNEEKIEQLLAIVDEPPPGQRTRSLRALGARFGAQRAVSQRDSTTAAAAFAAAARIYREIERRFELAVVLLEHAEWLSDEGRPDEAEPLAAEAREIFERLRAAPYLERLDRLPTGAAAAR
jgi:class 3 adenylate cyclase/tetratricopeptide (TPR) repeat protein